MTVTAYWSTETVDQLEIEFFQSQSESRTKKAQCKRAFRLYKYLRIRFLSLKAFDLYSSILFIADKYHEQSFMVSIMAHGIYHHYNIYQLVSNNNAIRCTCLIHLKSRYYIVNDLFFCASCLYSKFVAVMVSEIYDTYKILFMKKMQEIFADE